ncbi:MAG: transposase [Allobaculum sp.]|nr:transposase [Allobaculum sp.]
MKSKKVRLEPTQEQEQFFWRFSRVNRMTWNACKAKFDEVYKTEKKYLSLKELREYIRDLRNNDPKFSDFQGVPVAVTSQSIKDLLDTYKRFYSARKKKGYDPEKSNKFKPKFKKYNKTTPSFYQRIDGIHKTDDTHIKLTGIKTPVKCTALRNVDLPDKIQNPRITYDGKYWYLSYSFEAEPQTETSQSSEETLGIDVGVKDLAVLSNGKHYSNINQETKIGKLNKRLKRLQRQVSRKYEKNATYDSQGRKIYHKTNNIKKLERRIKLLKRRIHNIQQNYIYEVINDILAIHPKTIVVENLNLRGMLKIGI